MESLWEGHNQIGLFSAIDSKKLRKISNSGHSYSEGLIFFLKKKFLRKFMQLKKKKADDGQVAIRSYIP